MDDRLTFRQFVECFRKQFLLQKPPNHYLSMYNNEQGLTHGRWPATLFIEIAREQGFDDDDIQEEMGISRQELLDFISHEDPDIAIRRKMITKRKLVNNAVKWRKLLNRIEGRSC